MTIDQKLDKGIELGNQLFDFALSLSKHLKKSNPDGLELNRSAIMKGFLICSAQLSFQIITAVKNSSLYLAIIGMRTLLQFDVDACYIFDHPMHKNDTEWVDDLCRDIFDRTNSLKAKKNLLKEAGLAKRARDIGRKDLYDNNYAGLSDYAHLVIRPPFLNKRETYEEMAPKIISQALCNLTDIIDSIISFNDLKWNEVLHQEVISFRNLCES